MVVGVDHHGEGRAQTEKSLFASLSSEKEDPSL
jgi:hypothetical protein